MKRLSAVALLVLIAVFCSIALVSAQSAGPEFKLGFKDLADQISGIVGTPLEDEHWGANGDSLQQTTTGLMVWRKADNWTAFTNGSRTWISGPTGVQDRANEERFEWESMPVPSTPATASAPSPLPTASLSAPTVLPSGVPAWKPDAIPVGEARTIDTYFHKITLQVVEVVRNAEQRIRDAHPTVYQAPGPLDEYALIKVRISVLTGAPGDKFFMDPLFNVEFRQQNGSRTRVPPVLTPDPDTVGLMVAPGETKEGWIPALVNKGASFVMVYKPTYGVELTFGAEGSASQAAPASPTGNPPSPISPPAATPTPIPTPVPVPTATSAPTGSSGCGPGYINSSGQWVPSPCGNASGATAQCRDGTYSYSQSRSGTCSGHGGVARWLN